MVPDSFVFHPVVNYWLLYFLQASGIRLGVMVTNLANMGAALTIAFIYGWQLTLLILAFVPLLGLGGALQMKMMAGVAGMVGIPMLDRNMMWLYTEKIATCVRRPFFKTHAFCISICFKMGSLYSYCDNNQASVPSRYV